VHRHVRIVVPRGRLEAVGLCGVVLPRALPDELPLAVAHPLEEVPDEVRNPDGVVARRASPGRCDVIGRVEEVLPVPARAGGGFGVPYPKNCTAYGFDVLVVYEPRAPHGYSVVLAFVYAMRSSRSRTMCPPSNAQSAASRCQGTQFSAFVSSTCCGKSSLSSP
jgi:hypothetical protein